MGIALRGAGFYEWTRKRQAEQMMEVLAPIVGPLEPVIGKVTTAQLEDAIGLTVAARSLKQILPALTGPQLAYVGLLANPAQTEALAAAAKKVLTGAYPAPLQAVQANTFALWQIGTSKQLLDDVNLGQATIDVLHEAMGIKARQPVVRPGTTENAILDDALQPQPNLSQAAHVKKIEQLQAAVSAVKSHKDICGLLPAAGQIHVHINVSTGAPVIFGVGYKTDEDRLVLAGVRAPVPSSALGTGVAPTVAVANWLVRVGHGKSDNGGHAIGRQFGGSGNLYEGNLFPLEAKTNQAGGDWWKLDQKVASLKKANPAEDICIFEVFLNKPGSPKAQIRPDLIFYTYTSMGRPLTTPVDNP
jgi:hypothetical protein